MAEQEAIVARNMASMQAQMDQNSKDFAALLKDFNFMVPVWKATGKDEPAGDGAFKRVQWCYSKTKGTKHETKDSTATETTGTVKVKTTSPFSSTETSITAGVKKEHS